MYLQRCVWFHLTWMVAICLRQALEMIMSNTTHHNNCERNREEILAALLFMTIAPNFPTRHVFRLHGITLMPLSR